MRSPWCIGELPDGTGVLICIHSLLSIETICCWRLLKRLLHLSRAASQGIFEFSQTYQCQIFWFFPSFPYSIRRNAIVRAADVYASVRKSFQIHASETHHLLVLASPVSSHLRATSDSNSYFPYSYIPPTRGYTSWFAWRAIYQITRAIDSYGLVP